MSRHASWLAARFATRTEPGSCVSNRFALFWLADVTGLRYGYAGTSHRRGTSDEHRHRPRRHLHRRSRPLELRLRRPLPGRLALPRHARRGRTRRSTDGRLEGAAKVESISIRTPEQFRAHVLSAEFFDAENHPRSRSPPTDLDLREDGTATVDGELTIKGITRPVTATGTWIAPAADAFGNTRGHLNLEAVRSTAPQFDMNWNAPLPSGGKALANEVTLTVELSLVEQALVRCGSSASPAACAGAPTTAGCSGRRATRSRPGWSSWSGTASAACPIFDEDLETDPPASGAGVPRRDRGRRRAADRHAGVQRLAARRAQERARLGLAPVPGQRAARQAERGDRRRAPACSAPSGRRPRCARC